MIVGWWRWATEFDRALLINAGLLFPNSYGKREEWLAALAMCPLFSGVIVGPVGGVTLTIPEGPFSAIGIDPERCTITEVCLKEVEETPEKRRARVAAWVAGLP